MPYADPEQARLYNSEYRNRNREKLNARERQRRKSPEARKHAADYARTRYQEKTWAERVITAKNRRTTLSLEELSRLQQATEQCDCCSRELDYSVSKRTGPKNDNAATLDKLVPELGYVSGNVAIICWRCNRFKNAMSVSDVKNIHAYMTRYIEKL